MADKGPTTLLYMPLKTRLIDEPYEGRRTLAALSLKFSGHAPPPLHRGTVAFGECGRSRMGAEPVELSLCI